MTGLRTMWGVNTLKIQSFGPEKAAYFNKMVIKEVAGGYINKIENDFMLTALGKHFADRIAMNLFIIEYNGHFFLLRYDKGPATIYSL